MKMQCPLLISPFLFAECSNKNVNYSRTASYKLEMGTGIGEDQLHHPFLLPGTVDLFSAVHYLMF